MAASRTQLQKIQHKLYLIQVNVQHKQQSTFIDGEREDLLTLAQLKQLIDNELSNLPQNDKYPSDLFRSQVKQFLKDRWQRIANGPLCYTINLSYPYNKICVALAEYLENTGRNALLMPEVVNEDVYGNELSELEFGEFILTDDRRRFISIDSLIDTACLRIKSSRNPLFITTNANGGQVDLTQSELDRLGRIRNILDSIKSWYQTRQSTMLEELVVLRDCLLRGDASHSGTEMNAGVSANVGIANFYALFNTLSDEAKDQLCQFVDSSGHYSLGEVLGRLFRPSHANYRSVSYCIQMLGRQLESIINNNLRILGGLSTMQSQNLEYMINLVKSKFCVSELSVLRNRNSTMHSQINPDLSFDENNWVVSFISPRAQGCSHFLHARIIVEGVKDNELFVGTYWPTFSSPSSWMPFSGLFMNAQGVFTKINAYESRGYTKIPKFNIDGGLQIDANGDFFYQFDHASELRASSYRSHRVTAERAMAMIKEIKKDQEATDFANWISNISDHASTSEVEKQRLYSLLGSNQAAYSLFIQAGTWGSLSFFGSGKDNAVTWCEKKLEFADAGESRLKDNIKAKPVNHVAVKRY